MFSPTEPTVSLTTRRVMYGIVFICGINYVMRLFSISFIGVFRWYPDGWRQMAVDEAKFLKMLAWFEFGMITGLILIIASVCLAFIYLREVVKFIIGGWSNVTMNRTSFWLMLWSLAMNGGSFGMMFSGPDALIGTRAAGLGYSGMMFLTMFVTAGSTSIIFAYVLEPQGTQDAFDQRQKRQQTI